MTAGEGAAEQARLAAERVARLRRELEQAERQEKAWAAGAAGEALVAQKLADLEARGWLSLHDVHWPGRPKANLDHVLVGPGGIVVIDAKNWSGDVNMRNGVLYQANYTRERETASALQQAAAVAALLEPPHRHLVQAWLCMVAQPEMRAVTSTGVKICGIDTLPDAVGLLPEVLDADAVKVIHEYLTRLLAADASPALLTTASLEKDGGRGSSARSFPSVASGSSRARYPNYRHGHLRRRSQVVQVGVHPGKRVVFGCLLIIVIFFVAPLVLGLISNFVTAFGHHASPVTPRPTPAVTRLIPSPYPVTR